MAPIAQGIGLFCTVAALALLIAVCCSTPTSNSIRFLTVDGGLLGEARLGLYGFSYRLGRGDWQEVGTQLGYGQSDLPGFLGDGLDILHAITVVMGVFHPLTAAVIVLAILFPLGGTILSFIGAILAFLSLLLSLCCVGLDAGLAAIARHEINDNLPGDPASIGIAVWLMVPVPVLLLIATITICVGAFTKRRHRKVRRDGVIVEKGAEPVVSEKPVPRRRWWQRRRY